MCLCMLYVIEHNSQTHLSSYLSDYVYINIFSSLFWCNCLHFHQRSFWPIHWSVGSVLHCTLHCDLLNLTGLLKHSFCVKRKCLLDDNSFVTLLHLFFCKTDTCNTQKHNSFYCCKLLLGYLTILKRACLSKFYTWKYAIWVSKLF